jgi:hypothetical protein
MASAQICFHNLNGTCKYGSKCFKLHLTKTEFREMNKNLSPCFEFCANGVCTGHGGEGCLFAKDPNDYIEACDKRGKIVDKAVVKMLEEGMAKAEEINNEGMAFILEMMTNDVGPEENEKLLAEMDKFIEVREEIAKYEEWCDENKPHIEELEKLENETVLSTPKKAVRDTSVAPVAPVAPNAPVKAQRETRMIDMNKIGSWADMADMV